MKNFWKDFKAFISKGNVIDLAIAVIVGGAFGKIVTSLVNDIIMPLISLATGGVSISDWKWVITPADPVAGIAESALYYGSFIQTILDFLIISFFIFLAIRLLQKSKKKIDEIAQDFKTEIKKKKKNKKGEIIQKEITVESQKDVAVEQESDLKKPENDDITSAILKLTEESEKTNKSQENLLIEIRDLLKGQQTKKKKGN